MNQVLLVTQNKDNFKEIAEFLGEKNFLLSWAGTGEEAIASISDMNILLVIVDEKLPDMTGLEFIEKSIFKNPMIYSAAVSSLSHEEFHEASEGFGVLMQLSVPPGRSEAEKLYAHLEGILSHL